MLIGHKFNQTAPPPTPTLSSLSFSSDLQNSGVQSFVTGLGVASLTNHTRLRALRGKVRAVECSLVVDALDHLWILVSFYSVFEKHHPFSLAVMAG